MKILSLTAENIKKLKAVRIVPTDNVVMVTGKNGAGKSSVLDCILYALGGGKELPEKPIRDGADKGEIVIDLAEITVTRTITQKGSYLEIKNKAGFKAPSPQALLDKLFGKVMDPLMFFAEKDQRKLRATLLDILGVNLDDQDRRIAALRDERKLINKEKETLAFEAGRLMVQSTVSAQEISIAELAAELEQANKHNAGIEEAKEEARKIWYDRQKLDTSILNRQTLIDTAKKEIEKLKADLARLESLQGTETDGRDKLKEEFDTRKAAIDAMTPADTAAITSRMQQAEATNKLIRQNQKRQELLEKAKLADAAYKDKQTAIEKIEAEKVEILKSAKMPVEGLAVTDDGVLFNSNPISQASDGEKLRIGIALSMALNPTIKVLRITDGSLLDSDNLAAISKMVKDNDYQLWIERVSDDDTMGIYIEDGEIKAIEKSQDQ